MKVAHGIKVANQLPLRWKSILDVPGGPRVIAGSLKVEKESQRMIGLWKKALERLNVAGFKEEDSDPESRNAGASGSWKRPGNRFSPAASRKELSPSFCRPVITMSEL